jgi:enterochelin esterase-like enzyme
MVLFMLPIRGRAESSRIEQFLTRVQNLPESRRQAQVETFTRTYPHSPVIANGDVLFYYRGSGIEKISITADWNAWRKPDLMENIPGTDFHYFKKSFEADACLRYNYILGDKNLLDPRNPRQAWHWENKASELRMPGYKTPAEFNGPANPIKGTLLDLELESKNLKETRHFKIYLPPGYQTGNQRYPVLYTQDGFAFVRRFEMIRSIEWGLVKNSFSPFIAVFVEPVDRREEYRGSRKESYKTFFVSELVPYIDSRYRTRANAGDRVLIGSSRGGLISLDLGFHYPGIFSQVAALSPAIPPTDMIDIFRNGEKKNLHIYMSIGRYEPRWLKDALRLRDVLKEKGYRLTFYKPNEGHSIYSWRAQFGTIFKIFFGEQGNGSGTIRGRASSFPAFILPDPFLFSSHTS